MQWGNCAISLGQTVICKMLCSLIEIHKNVSRLQWLCVYISRVSLKLCNSSTNPFYAVNREVLVGVEEGGDKSVLLVVDCCLVRAYAEVQKVAPC